MDDFFAVLLAPVAVYVWVFVGSFEIDTVTHL